jgi:hypothetical protein
VYGCIILYSGGVLFSFFFIFGSRYGLHLQCQQDRAARAGTGGDRATDASASRRRRPRVAACASGPSPAGRRPRGQGPGPRPLARPTAPGRAPVPPLRGARIRRSDQCVSYVWGAPDAGALLFFKISMCMKSTLTVTCQSLARASLLGCRRLQLGHLVRCPPLPLASDSAFIPRAAGLGADLLPIACDARASVDSA